jgi:hypothetical protein
LAAAFFKFTRAFLGDLGPKVVALVANGELMRGESFSFAASAEMMHGELAGRWSILSSYRQLPQQTRG